MFNNDVNCVICNKKLKENEGDFVCESLDHEYAAEYALYDGIYFDSIYIIELANDYFIDRNFSTSKTAVWMTDKNARDLIHINLNYIVEFNASGRDYIFNKIKNILLLK